MGKNYIVYDISLIQKLKISVSIKKNVTYWAFVSNKLKRIAKNYFLELKKKGIEVISMGTTAINKSQCLGISKNGLICSRFIKGSYCFQHKEQNITFIDLF